MQRLRIFSTFSITQDTENAIEKLQKAEKELSRKGGGNLAPRDRVMDKNYVKASYNTTRGFRDVNESKWCNAYADNTIHPHRLDFPCTFSAEPTFLPFLRISRKRIALPNVDAMAKT